MRKIVAVIILSIMSLSLLTGCMKISFTHQSVELEKTEQEEDKSKDKDTKKDKKDKKDKKVKTDKKDWTTLEGEGEAQNFEGYTLISANSNQIVMLNEDGSVKNVLELTGDLEANNDYNDFITCVSGDKIVYCKSSDSAEEGMQNLYLYDIDAEKWTLLDSIESYSFISCINNAVYLESTEYDTDSGKNTYTTTEYTVNEQGEVTKEEVYKALNEERTEKELYIQSNYYGSNTSFTTAYCLDKFGFAVYAGADKICLYDENGKEINSFETATDHHPEIKAVSKDLIVFEEYDEDYELSGIYMLDVSSMKCEQVNYDPYVYSEYNQPTVLGMENDIIYLTDRINYYNPERAVVSGYDINTGESYPVVTEYIKPGHTYLSAPIVYNFYVFGDKAYYLAESDKATEWYCLTRVGKTWEKKPLNVVAKEYDYYKYATIENYSYSDYCPYCGTLCYVDYYEWPVINSNVKNADKINETIEAMVKVHEEAAESYTPSFTEEDCRDFLHKGTNFGYDMDDCRISKISEVLDHYLFIERNGYQNFAGAAHGMPYGDNLIFDLNTGEEVHSLREMIDVSETELKELVAQSAADDFDTAYEGKYFAATKEDLYNQVYDETSLDFGFVSFFDDYMTFDFQPYDLGPFASGTISVPVYYKDLRTR